MITDKMIEPGKLASPGTPLLRLEDTRGFRLEVRVDESRIGEIRNGDGVRVFGGEHFDRGYGGRGQPGRGNRCASVSRQGRIARCPGRSIRRIRQGPICWHAAARIDRSAAAIVRRGQITSVFVVEHGIARARLVSLSESEVLAGLTEAEMVILSPPAGMTDGHHVHVGGR